MIASLVKRMLTEPAPRVLGKFIWNFGWKGMRAVQRFEKRTRTGGSFPAFLFLSVTNRCNLRCQGCWVSPTDPAGDMPVAMLDGIIAEANRHGSYFFGILGGEPLLYEPLWDVLARHPESYFILFTNGQLLDEGVARRMRELGNVSPLVSIEGDAVVSDVRRGGRDVYARTLAGLACCRRARLITGVATSVCKTNLGTLATQSFLEELVELGVHYAWYYIYRPVGPDPAPDLALSESEVVELRRFMVEVRSQVPIAVVDAYWDHDGNALCPAGTGIGHHINPFGQIEPCPPIQFAGDQTVSGSDLGEVFAASEFLPAFRSFACERTRGCILMEEPGILKAFMEEHGAADTTGRGSGREELAAMTGRPCHHLPGQEIPERQWAYRFAKKHWFFGFGAYG